MNSRIALGVGGIFGRDWQFGLRGNVRCQLTDFLRFGQLQRADL